MDRRYRIMRLLSAVFFPGEYTVYFRIMCYLFVFVNCICRSYMRTGNHFALPFLNTFVSKLTSHAARASTNSRSQFRERLLRFFDAVSTLGVLDFIFWQQHCVCTNVCVKSVVVRDLYRSQFCPAVHILSAAAVYENEFRYTWWPKK